MTTDTYTVPVLTERGIHLQHEQLTEAQKVELKTIFPQKSVIRVFGTVGAGKGTISGLLSGFFDIPYLDTGLIWRAIAYAYTQFPHENTPEHTKYLLNKMNIIPQGQYFSIFLEEKELTKKELRNPEIDAIVANYAIHRQEFYQFIIENILQIDRAMILDGRGSQTPYIQYAEDKEFMVFRILFYVTAEEAARRRFIDYENKYKGENQGQELSELQKQIVLQEIKEKVYFRDRKDYEICLSQNTGWVTPDTACIDTTLLTVNEVFESVLAFIWSRIKHIV